MVDLGCNYSFPTMESTLPDGVLETMSSSRLEKVKSYLEASKHHIANSLGLFSNPKGSLQPTNVVITVMQNFIGDDFPSMDTVQVCHTDYDEEGKLCFHI